MNGGLDLATGEPCAAVVEARPLLRLSKTTLLDPTAGAVPGAAVTYVVRGTNTGADDYGSANPVPIWDDLTGVLAGASYLGDAKAEVAGQDAGPVVFDAAGADGRKLLKWEGPLARGESVVITYSVKLAPDGAASLRNVAWVPRADPPLTPDCDQSAGVPDDPASHEVCAASLLARPLLSIEKTSNASDARAGDTVHYTVTATNVGAAAFTPAAPALVYDDLNGVMDDSAGPPAGLRATRDGATPPAPTYLPAEPPLPVGKIRWAGALPAGESVVIEYDVTLRAGGDGHVDNVAWGPVGRSTTNPDTPTDCDTAAHRSPATGEPCDAESYRLPDFSVTKTFAGDGDDTDHPVVGDAVTFTIDIENTSDAAYTDARPLVLVDSLAQTLAEAEFTAYGRPAVSGAGDIDFTVPPLLTYTGALAPGESAQITYTVQLTSAGDGRFANVVFEPGAAGPPACLDAGGAALQNGLDPATGGRCARVDVAFPVLRLAKSSNMPQSWSQETWRSGDEITYNVVVTNTGGAAISGATVVDDLQGVIGNGCAILVPDSLTPTGAATYDGGDKRITWTGGLGTSDSATISYRVTTQNCSDNSLVNVAWQPADPTAADPPAPACDASPLDAATGEPCAKSDSPLPAVALSKVHAITRGGVLLEPDQAPKAGDVVTYTITATNTGTVPYTEAAPLVLRDDLTDVEASAVIDAASWTAEWDSSGPPGTGSFARSDHAMVWTGALAPGRTVTLEFAAALVGAGQGTVRNVVWEPANPFSPNPPVPQCDGGRTRADPSEACAEAVFERPALKVEKVAETPGATPLKTGDTVEFTITVTNTGAVPFPDSDPALVYDSLEDVLAGARYNGDARIVDDPGDGGKGELTYQADRALIAWTGPLAAGEEGAVQIKFSATLEGRGEANLYNVAWAPTDPSSLAPPACPATGVDPTTNEPCARVGLARALIHMEKTVTVQGQSADDLPRAGDVLTYQVVFRNIGNDSYGADHPAHLYDDISDVLANAAWNEDSLTATPGGAGAASLPGYPEVDLGEGLISWAGALPAWGQVTLVYSVTLRGEGDGSITNTAWAPVDPGDTTAPSLEQCPPRADLPDPNETSRCASTELDRGLVEVDKALINDPPALPQIGDVLTYQVTMTNTGAADYPLGSPAALRDDLSGALDGAYYLNDAQAQYYLGDLPQAAANPPVYSAPQLTWNGPLSAGQSVRITYSLQVRNPTGGGAELRNLAWSPDHPFTAESPPVPTCAKQDPSGPGDPATLEPCDLLVAPRGLLTLTKAADSDGTVLPGQVVTYTVEVENLSGLAYDLAQTPAVVWDDLSDVLGEGAYEAGSLNPGAGATANLDPATGLIRWEGSIPAYGKASFSYQIAIDARGDGVIRNVAWVPSDPQERSVAAPPCRVSTDGQPVVSVSTGETCAGLTLYSPLLALAKESSPRGAVLPGGTIEYTVTATNIGAGDFPDGAAVIWDDLAPTLDDADLVAGTLAADSGTVEFFPATGMLKWHGPLARNGTVVIVYTVRVKGGGDGRIANVAWQPLDPDEPPACADAPDGIDAATGQPCALDNHNLPKLTIAKRLVTPGPYPQGQQAEYEVLITNSGGAAFTNARPAVVLDDLFGLLDGGVYNYDATAVLVDGGPTGAVAYDQPVLSWTGPLAAGAAVRLTYSVTWLAVGDGRLRNVAWQPADPADPAAPDCGGSGGSGGGADGIDPGTGMPCAVVEDTRPLLKITKTSDALGRTLTAGDVVRYTITATNTGQADYDEAFPAVVVDSLAALLGETSYNGDAAASLGGRAANQPTFDPDTQILRWSGPLEMGQTVTVTFSITLLAGGAGVGRNVAWSPLDPTDPAPPAPSCDPGGGASDPDTEPCDFAAYTRPTLSISKSSDASNPWPGDTVTFKILATNTSLEDFTDAVPAIVQDDLTGVLDDATFDVADVVVTADAPGALTYAEPLLTWRGPLASGQSVELAIKVVLLPVGDGLVRNIAWRPNTDQPAPATPACDPAQAGQDRVTLEPCAVTVFDKSGLALTKTANPPDPMPGAAVTYNVTLENTGQLAFTEESPAALFDDLADVLEAGALTSGPVILDGGPGSVSLVGGSLVRWYGPLDPGQKVVLQYAVALQDSVAATRGGNVAWVPKNPSASAPPAPQCLEVDASGLDAATGELCARVQLTPPVLEIAKASEVVRPGDPEPPAYPRPGDQIAYALTIANKGSGAYTAAHPAVVVDSLANVLDDATWDDAAVIVSGGGGLTWDGSRLEWSGTLAPGAQVVVTYSVTLTGGGDGQVSNVVWVPDDPDTPGDPPACEQAAGDWCASDTLPMPELSLVKTAAQSPAGGAWQAGVRLTYTLTMKNTGKGDFTAEVPAVVRDDLTGVLDDAAWAGVVSAPEAGSVAWDSPVLVWTGPLAAGATVELAYAVDLTTGGDGVLDNLAWFPLHPDDPSPPEPGCSAPVGGQDPVTGEPCDLIDQRRPILEIVSKSVDGGNYARPGDWLTYTVTARNRGAADFTADRPAVVADSLAGLLDDSEPFDPATASDAGAGGRFDYDDPLLTWTGPLAVGDQVVLTYRIQLAGGGDGDLANVAWGPRDPDHPLAPECGGPDSAARSSGGGFSRESAGGIDPVSGESCALCDLRPPVLAITKSSRLVRPGADAEPPHARPGDQVEYTLRIANTGLGAYTRDRPAVVVDSLADVLDDSEPFDPATASDNGAGGQLDYAEPLLTWTGAVAAGQAVTVTYRLTLTGGGDHLVKNTVWAPLDPVEPVPPECEDPDGQWCGQDEVKMPELLITKTASAAAWSAGAPLTYTLTLENTGQGDYTAAAPATVRDDLTDILDDSVWSGFGSVPAAGSAAWSSPVLTWSGPLAAGSSVKLVYSVRLTLGGDGRLRNLAWSPADPSLPDPPAPECQADPSGLDPATGEACALVDQRRPILEVLSKRVDGEVEGTVDVRPGELLTYRVQLRNRGPVDFTAANPAVLADSLVELLDDCEPFDIATASDGGAGGSFSYAEPVLAWRGPIEAGGEVTLVYSVRLSGGGDRVLQNVAWAPRDPDSSAPPAPSAPGCDDPDSNGFDPVTGEACAAKDVTPPSVRVAKTVAAPNPLRIGDRLVYTVVVTNASPVRFTAERPAVVIDDLTGILDDATYQDDARASLGAVANSQSRLVWTGPLDPGQSATITYSAKLAGEGDGRLRNIAWAAQTSISTTTEPPPADCATFCSTVTLDAPARLPLTGPPTRPALAALAALTAGVLLLLLRRRPKPC
ncbi:MAG: DUF11 domain-containing protein [Bifidobacteriaceae bacterium]|jgi:uncharacterized repeat protein (TIGR01451 family)|nr:DUF11 domain-containing protein [Bifidobacteriaceae bacterium]